MIIDSSKDDIEVWAAGILLEVVDILNGPGNIGVVADLDAVFRRITSPGEGELLMMGYVEGLADIHQIDY